MSSRVKTNFVTLTTGLRPVKPIFLSSTDFDYFLHHSNHTFHVTAKYVTHDMGTACIVLVAPTSTMQAVPISCVNKLGLNSFFLFTPGSMFSQNLTISITIAHDFSCDSNR